MRKQYYEPPIIIRFEAEDFHDSRFLWSMFLKRVGIEDKPNDVALIRVRTEEVEVWYNKDDLGG